MFIVSFIVLSFFYDVKYSFPSPLPSFLPASWQAFFSPLAQYIAGRGLRGEEAKLDFTPPILLR
jgi:hypothetical protein